MTTEPGAIPSQPPSHSQTAFFCREPANAHERLWARMLLNRRRTA